MPDSMDLLYVALVFFTVPWKGCAVWKKASFAPLVSKEMNEMNISVLFLFLYGKICMN